MLKKLVIMFIIVAFISVSVFATIPVNSDNAKKEIKLSKEVVTLSTQELEFTIGLGWFSWACAEATLVYAGACVGVSAAGVATLGAGFCGAIVVALAMKAMVDACS